MDVLQTGIAHYVLCEIHGTSYSLHQDGMDRWSTFAIFLTRVNLLAEQLQHRKCESGNKPNNSTIKEVGCSWLVCLQLIFELRYDANMCKVRAASDFQHSVHRHLFCPSNFTRWGSLRFAPIILNILSCCKVHTIIPCSSGTMYALRGNRFVILYRQTHFVLWTQ